LSDADHTFSGVRGPGGLRRYAVGAAALNVEAVPALALRSDLDDGCAIGGSLHALAASPGVGEGLVGFAGGDDLAVAGLEAEPLLAGLVLVDLELACHRSSLLARAQVARASSRCIRGR